MHSYTRKNNEKWKSQAGWGQPGRRTMHRLTLAKPKQNRIGNNTSFTRWSHEPSTIMMDTKESLVLENVAHHHYHTRMRYFRLHTNNIKYLNVCACVYTYTATYDVTQHYPKQIPLNASNHLVFCAILIFKLSSNSILHEVLTHLSRRSMTIFLRNLQIISKQFINGWCG